MLSPDQMKELVVLINKMRNLLQQRAVELGTMKKGGESYWGLLRLIQDQGPLPIPELARLRGVSRQRIQRLVDEYLSLGDLKLLENPSHKRSKLVALTDQGVRNTQAMSKAIDEGLLRIQKSLSSDDLSITLKTLNTINSLLVET